MKVPAKGFEDVVVGKQSLRFLLEAYMRAILTPEFGLPE
jgi:hypothetical protein